MSDAGQKILDMLLAEYDSDVRITTFNLEDKVMLSSTYISKWIGIHSEHKIQLEKMNTELLDMRKHESQLIRAKLKIDAPDAQIAKLKLKFQTGIRSLEELIHDYGHIIDVLSKLERAIGYYKQDIRNVLEYRRLETI